MHIATNIEPSSAEREVLHGLVAELREVIEQRQGMDRKVEELRRLIGQLEARHGIDADDPTSVMATVSTTRVGAVEAVLREADDAVTLADVDEELDRRGLPESRKNIASALSYLGSKARAHRVARGRWAYGPDPSA